MEPNTTNKLAFTLVEILWVLTIIAILGAFIVPAYVTSRARGRQAMCVSNVRQIGMAVAIYTQNYDGSYPPVSSSVVNSSTSAAPGPIFLWTDLIRPFIAGGLYMCPDSPDVNGSNRDTSMSGYAYNRSLNRAISLGSGYILDGKAESEVKVSQLTVLSFDARTGIIAMSCPDDNQFMDHFPSIIAFDSTMDGIDRQKSGGRRHSNGANYSFVDGHVKWLEPGSLKFQCDETRPCFRP